MKIAIVSPFSPDKSGVSDFCEELVLELKKHLDIDLFARKYIENPEITNNFRVYNISDLEDENIRNQYDHVIYQVGNNTTYHEEVIKLYLKYPGILELHDLSLHHYLAESTYARKNYKKYIEIMKYCHGKDGERTAKRFLAGEIREPWENQSEKYTVNKFLVDKAKAVIVHSDMAKQTIKAIRPEVPVINIPLHTPDIYKNYEDFREKCKEELGIAQDVAVMGSFGYATIAKRIPQVLQALGEYKKRAKKKFVYYIVGKVDGIDVKKLARLYNIEKGVIVTGFTELEDFKRYMGACDICFNLRYPTQGESSASLHRMLGMGKPILVTNIGSFEEYPDDIVVKIHYDDQEVDEIVNELEKLLSDESERKRREKKSFQYANEKCNLTKNAVLYKEFFESLTLNRYEDDYMTHFLNYLTELELFDMDFLQSKLDFLEFLIK